MHDLTQGSVSKHLVALAVPIAAGMLFQTLYLLVDLYFVSRLGGDAVAGVSAAANVQMIVMGLTQVLGVGAMALVAQATGRGDRADANLIFNQSLVFAATCAAFTLVAGYAFAPAYMAQLGADQATADAGTDYLNWFLPGLALQFALVAMGSALRGSGVAKPTMIVQVVSVILNAILAPVLIAGWGTGHALGVAGAGLASTIAIGAGVAVLLVYFIKAQNFVHFEMAAFAPRLEAWRRILRIGLPSGGEFALMFLFSAVTYWVTRRFGAEAQAGFGIGMRVMQSIFLPAMAVAFAAAPLAGQNVGARRFERVRQTLRQAAGVSTVMMAVLTLLCQWRPEVLIGSFTDNPAVANVAAEFLRFLSWNFVASGIIFTCSGLFQAFGNTLPALASSASRLATFAVPALALAGMPWFELRHLWMLSVASATVQATVSYLLLRREFARRVPHDAAAQGRA